MPTRVDAALNPNTIKEILSFYIGYGWFLHKFLFNDISTLLGHFVASLGEIENRGQIRK